MCGLYVHIPFCKSRCAYCAFYSSTLLHLADKYVDALCKELTLRGPHNWSSVYIGGGTPSCLSHNQLKRLFQHIDCSSAAEVTIECNPDDVSPDFAQLLASLPVNRVSMGIQTFNNQLLQFLHRRHNAQQARKAVTLLRHAGFRNISVDLIYGFPNQTLSQWQDDVRQALQLNVEHISAYCLSIEPETPLWTLRQNGTIPNPDEDAQRDMYYYLCQQLANSNFVHYELSNFCQPNHRAIHNSSYWTGTPYIGIGAAAHSLLFADDAQHFLNLQSNSHPDITKITPKSYANSLPDKTAPVRQPNIADKTAPVRQPNIADKTAPVRQPNIPDKTAPVRQPNIPDKTAPIRQWNIADVNAYINSVNSGVIPAEGEILSPAEQYNDMVMLSLRTREGLNLTRLQSLFGSKALHYCLNAAQPFLNPTETISLNPTSSQSETISLNPQLPHPAEDVLSNPAAPLLVIVDNNLRLTRPALFVSDMVISALMKV